MTSRFLDLLAQLVIRVEIEDIGDEVQRILIILHLGIETSQVEAISEIIFVDLTEVFVSPRGNELLKERKISTTLVHFMRNEKPKMPLGVFQQSSQGCFQTEPGKKRRRCFEEQL